MYLEELRKRSFACPSEWHGVLVDGMRVFVRYRSGRLSMGYGPTVEDAIGNAYVVWQSKDQLAGCMHTDSMLKLTGLAFNGHR